MQQYQIPKLRVDADVILAGGEEIIGSIFISENMISYTGKPRLEDFLNMEERFFPISRADGTMSLLNKHRLVLLRSSEDDSKVLVEQLMLKPKKVEIFLTNGHSVAGEIFSNLPQESLRTSDFFNQKEPFLPVYQEARKVIINTREVLYIND